MTQYLLSVHHDYSTPLFAEGFDVEASYAATGRVNEEMQAAGVWVYANGLEAPDTATVVRVVDGETLTTDGPLAEAKERIGGFWVLDVPDRDTALEWAAKATVACGSPVEVRPFQGG